MTDEEDDLRGLWTFILICIATIGLAVVVGYVLT